MASIIDHNYGSGPYGSGPYGGLPIFVPPVTIEGAGIFRDSGRGDLSVVPDLWYYEEVDEENFGVRE